MNTTTCINHPETESTKQCRNCAEMFCDSCVTKGTEHHYCAKPACQIELHKEILPDYMQCPRCREGLKLTSTERESKIIDCTSCNRMIDMTMDDGTLKFFRASTTRTRLESASTGKRFANYIIDGVIAQISNAIALGTILEILTVLFGEPNIVITFLAALIVPQLYYFGSESLTQKTPAKLITRTKVVMTDGTRPPAMAIFKRSLTRMVPFEPISGLGDGSWWHDEWSDTMVVDDN